MVFDGLTLQRVTAEISDSRGMQLRQLYQIGRTEFFFKLSKTGIEVSINPSSPYIAKGEREQNSPSLETPFSLFLRRHLNGFFLINVEQKGMDRILRLDFEGRDAFGEKKQHSLLIEFIGPGSNIIVLDEQDMIVQAFREMVTSKRTIARGLKYYSPDTPCKSLRGLSREEISSYLLESTDILSSAIRKSFIGFSRATAENIIGYLQLEDIPPAMIEEERLTEAAEFLSNLSSNSSDNHLFILEREDGTEISPIPLDHKNHCERVRASEAIKRALESAGIETEIDRRKTSIVRKIEKSSKRVVKLIEKLEKELAELENYEVYRRYGELLVANLYRLKERQERVELEDWETGKITTISLDKRLTPSENAQLFFKYFDKSHRKELHIKKRLRVLHEESEYLEQLKEMLLQAESIDEIREFSSELEEAGIVRKPKNARDGRKKLKRSGPRIFERDGFKYLVGRNNVENDEIRKNASRNDIWFHARGIPGAHVILKRAGMEISADAIHFGSLLAAKYSKGRQSGKVDVVYTEVQNVRKPKGAKPGMVLYRSPETITVDLTKEMVERN